MDVYNFKPVADSSGYTPGTQSDEEVFDMASRMLMFACMHLIDKHPMDLDALRTLRYAQRALISEYRLKQVEEALDKKEKQNTYSSIQFGSSMIWSSPCTGNTATTPFPPVTLHDVTITTGKP